MLLGKLAFGACRDMHCPKDAAAGYSGKIKIVPEWERNIEIVH